MEYLTLPSIGASFKKWRCYIPILPKALAHSPKFQKKKFKIFKKNGQSSPIQVPTRGWPMTSGRPSALTPGQGQIAPFIFIFIFILPFTFCSSGQLLLVGSNTCLPCSNFS
jgi:hypothetical protein